MNARQRTRFCVRQRTPQGEGTPRGSRQIVIPMTREIYDRIWGDPAEVRRFLEPRIETVPELFPVGIAGGFQLTGRLPESKQMPGVRLRQLRLGNADVFTIRPSFAFSYMMGEVDELEHPLLLLSFGVPCWVVTHLFGHSDMYWERLLERLGRNRLVGTTVRDPKRSWRCWQSCGTTSRTMS